jgi:hypothetical protein
MLKGMVSSISAGLSSGGTVEGDITITEDLVVQGDLKVEGGGSFAFDEIIEGTQVIEKTDTEAFLVRKASDGGDIFVVDTTNGQVKVNVADTNGRGLLVGSNASVVWDNPELKFNVGSGQKHRFDVNGSTKLLIDASTISGSANFTTTGWAKASYFTNSTINNNTVIRGNNTGVDIDIQDSSGSSIAFFEASNKRLGLGTTSPSSHLDLVHSDTTTPSINLTRTVIGNTSYTNRAVLFDINKTSTMDSGATLNYDAMHIDFDDSGADNAASTVNLTGLKVDVNSDDATGTTKNVGLNVSVGGADTNYAALFDGGYVGIGGDPTTTLDVNDNGVQLVGNLNYTILARHSSMSRGVVLGHDGGAAAGFISAYGASNDLIFATHNGTAYGERMRLDHDGRLGIGTTSPSANLHIKDASSYTQLKIESGSVDQQTYLTMEADRPAENDIIANIQFTSAGSLAGDIKYFRGSSDAKGSFKFGTGSSGGTRFVLDDDSRISLSNNDSGTSNTVFGKSIGDIDAGSNYNVFIGEEVASDNTLSDATNNVVIGYQAGEDLTTADNCVFIGYQAGQRHSQSSGCTAVGYRAFYSTGGLDNWGNTFFGFGAASGNWTTSASNGNVGVGYQVLNGAMNDADYNVAVGYHAGHSMTQGDYNSLLGWKAGVSLTSGGNNVAIGNGALLSNSTGFQNVAVGGDALSHTTSDSNTAVGEKAGNRNTSGTFNTAVGRATFFYNQTGTGNTAIGYQAQHGVSDNSHSNNTSLGYRSMFGVTTGGENVAVGVNSLLDITTGNYNSMVGLGAGENSTDGSYNTAVGYYAMRGDASSGLTGGGINVALGYKALYAITTASNCIAIGGNALEDLTTGDSNIAIGRNALSTAASGENHNIAIGRDSMLDSNNSNNDYNVAIGGNTLKGGTYTVASNVAIGYGVMSDVNGTNTGGTYNTAIGYNTMNGTWTTASSNYNTAVGSQSMQGAMNGATDNTALGYDSLKALTEGDKNTAIGKGSLDSLTTGSQNTALGRTSLPALTTGGNNVGLGMDAGLLTTEGNHNIFIGTESGANNTTGDELICIGYRAGYAINHASNADGTISIGYEANKALTSGANQISIGYQAGKALTTAGNSTFIGYQAGLTHTGANNVAIGDRAFYNTDADANSLASTKNVAIGNLAMGGAINNTVTGAVAIGYYALGTATCGTSASYGVYIGHHANKNNGGGQNIAIGGNSLEDADGTETGNVAIGVSCMDNVNNDGSDFNTVIGNYAVRGGTGVYTENTAVGYEVHKGIGNQDVSREVAIGDGAGGGTIAGSCIGNVAIGFSALNANNRDGNYNVAIGQFAGNSITTGGNNICIGVDADPSAADATNQIVIGSSTTGLGDNYAVIGNANVTRLYVASDGAGVLYADGTIQSSDKRLKENIEDTDLGLDFINKLRPVKYNYIKDKHDGKTKYGIIAQEVQEVLKESNNEDFAGIKDSDEYLGADYVQFVAPLIKAVQELSAEVKLLKQQLKDK